MIFSIKSIKAVLLPRMFTCEFTQEKN